MYPFWLQQILLIAARLAKDANPTVDHDFVGL